MLPISTNKRTVYNIKGLNNMINRMIVSQKELQDIIVLGEVSNFKRSSHGHWYFSLKDDGAVIDAVMLSYKRKNMKDPTFVPEDGMEVFLKGNVDYYPSSGKLQLQAVDMAPNGRGNLHKQFEDMKKALKKEGLFDPQFKKTIPQFPKVIGVATSQTGAAVRDIITTIRRRYPIAKIELFPIVVQGDKAAPSVVKAIEFFNVRNTADVLIVGRGGGSIEDLWAFNEEVVARAIFNSKIPIISAVGHETDTTIADFVADKRAPTPTAAAELSTPITVSDLRNENEKILMKMTKEMQNKLRYQQEAVKHIQKNLTYHHPQRKLDEMFQEQDRVIDKMSSLISRKAENSNHELSKLKMRLNNQQPSQKINEFKKQLTHYESLLAVHIKTILTHSQNKLNEKIIQLDGLSPLKIMSKGYGLTYKEGSLIKEVDNLSENDRITVKMANGEYQATINHVERGTKNDE